MRSTLCHMKDREPVSGWSFVGPIILIGAMFFVLISNPGSVTGVAAVIIAVVAFVIFVLAFVRFVRDRGHTG